MRDPDRGVGGVDTLTTLARGAVDVDAQIGFVDLHLLDFFRFRVDEDTGGGRVDASLRFRDGHALHAVDTALELQSRPDPVTHIALRLDRQRRVLVSTQIGHRRVEDLDTPAVPLGVPDVHPGQIGGEQRGFLAALPRLHLEHHVVTVVRVAGGPEGR